MKPLKTCFVMLICIVAVPAVRADRYITNGGFETGDFIDWQETSDESWYGGYAEAMVILGGGTEGEYHAEIHAEAMPDPYDPAYASLSLAQDFSAEQGDVLSFDYFTEIDWFSEGEGHAHADCFIDVYNNSTG